MLLIFSKLIFTTITNLIFYESPAYSNIKFSPPFVFIHFTQRFINSFRNLPQHN